VAGETFILKPVTWDGLLTDRKLDSKVVIKITCKIGGTHILHQAQAPQVDVLVKLSFRLHLTWIKLFKTQGAKLKEIRELKKLDFSLGAR